jgi:methionyl-tRNA synthetase
MADVVARFYRAMGRDVYFQTGTDEHGQKIAENADAEGVAPIELCNRYADGFQCLNQRLGVRPDAFLRTTQDFHMETARELWRSCERNGDIYLGRYEGWYMVREERFVTDTEAEEWNFLDPVSEKPLTRMAESSYFFRLSKYYDRLISLVETTDFVQPKEYRNEMLARLKKEPLRDLSISRTTFDWGVECPVSLDEGKQHVMYVWFDALANYLSGVRGMEESNELARFWPADAHIIGKDIAWFHTVIWPAILWSANLPVPKSVWVHGFISGSDGRKMSKSLGNVVNPHDLLDEFTSDSLRWYFLRTTSFGDDLRFSDTQMKLMHNADMCDNLGNLVNRAVKLCGDRLPDAKPVGPYPFDVEKLRLEVDAAMAGQGTMEAANLVIGACSATNKWVADIAPWSMKTPEEQTRKKEVLRVLAEAIFVLAHFFAPFVPLAAEAIFRKFDAPRMSIAELRGFENLPDGCAIRAGSVLFELFADVVQEAAPEVKKAVKKKAAPPPDQPLFSKLDIRIGEIEEVYDHPEADRLYVEKINIGGEVRQIVSGLRDHYAKQDLEGRKILVLCNLKPRKLRNVESAGMVLCAKAPDGASTVELVDPPEDGSVGDRVTLPGEEGFPPLGAKAVAKQKVWDQVSQEFGTNEQRVVCYGGNPIVSPSGKPIVAPTLANQAVS